MIVALFMLAGTDLPKGADGRAWLDYLSGNETAWWAIVGLSVFTNVLWIAVAVGLYPALRTVDRAWSAMGAGLMVLFVILETTVSWPSYAALIDLSTRFSSATSAVERASIAAAADYAAALQASDLLPVYAIDLSTKLPVLSTYLDHESIAGTQRYLQLTLSLHPDLSSVLEQQYGALIPRGERA